MKLTKEAKLDEPAFSTVKIIFNASLNKLLQTNLFITALQDYEEKGCTIGNAYKMTPTHWNGIQTRKRNRLFQFIEDNSYMLYIMDKIRKERQSE